MRILIDIGHPAHVHLFKHFAWEMQEKEHEIFFTCREKEFEIYLLGIYGFKFKSFGNKYSSKLGKLWGLIEFDIKEFISGINFKPDLFLSHGSMYAAHAAFLLRKPHISFEDTGNWEQVRLYKPFTSSILTAVDFPTDYGLKQVRYNGHHEIAYLYPKRFTANNEIYELLGIPISHQYAIIRFVGWNASHDAGQSGLSLYAKREIINYLKNKLTVFITSEENLDSEFSEFQINIPPEKIHDAIAFATLFIGEGATMAMEASILGTPSFYINTLQYSNCMDMVNYGLLYSFNNSNGVEKKIYEVLSIPNLKEEWQKRREKMLVDKIDVTAFLIWFVENYPESVKVMKENPDYQYNFK